MPLSWLVYVIYSSCTYNNIVIFKGGGTKTKARDLHLCQVPCNRHAREVHIKLYIVKVRKAYSNFFCRRIFSSPSLLGEPNGGP